MARVSSDEASLNQRELNDKLAEIEANQRMLITQVAELSQSIIRWRRGDLDETRSRFRGAGFKYYVAAERGHPA